MKLKYVSYSKRFLLPGDPYVVWHLVHGKDACHSYSQREIEKGQYAVLCRNDAGISCWVDWNQEVVIVERTPYESVQDELKGK